MLQRSILLSRIAGQSSRIRKADMPVAHGAHVAAEVETEDLSFRDPATNT